MAGNGDRGDQISVRVTASGGVATSAAVTSPAKFVMDSPGAVSFVFTPIEHLYTDDVLSFSASHGDPDGDPTPTITYEWRVNGAAVHSTASLANTPAADFDLGVAGHGDVGETVAMYYAINGGPMACFLERRRRELSPVRGHGFHRFVVAQDQRLTDRRGVLDPHPTATPSTTATSGSRTRPT